MAVARSFRFESVLLEGRWQDNVCVGVDADGRIDSIESGVVDSGPGAGAIESGLVALPGMPNVHSHAFQRAFAGLSEYRTAEHDSFWTWRKLMFDFLVQFTPDDVYVIAKHLYLEMLSAGYTWVGEFHYLHNEVGGKPYGNIAEMSDAIFRAAEDSGIGLCHIPVLYQRGGFDDSGLVSGQKRFELSNDQFTSLVEHCRAKEGKSYSVGLALHSLRAVSTQAGNRALDLPGNDKCPIHIHVAEQTKEVDDCMAAHDRRPVEFLFDNYNVGSNWCLIHATHLTDNEVSMIAGSGAVAGLCPTTEANLGDGYFEAEAFLSRKGTMGVGTDSQTSVDMRDELRTLEYNQRLRTRRRAVLGTDAKSVGRRLYDVCESGGRKAIGLGTSKPGIGSRADFTLVDPEHPSIAGARHDRLIDRMVFSNQGNPIRGAIVGGALHDVQSDSFSERFTESSGAFVALLKRLSNC